MKYVQKIVKVVPNDYKKMLDKIAELKRNGLTDDAAAMQAFLATSVKQEKKPQTLVKK